MNFWHIRSYTWIYRHVIQHYLTIRSVYSAHSMEEKKKFKKKKGGSCKTMQRGRSREYSRADYALFWFARAQGSSASQQPGMNLPFPPFRSVRKNSCGSGELEGLRIMIYTSLFHLTYQMYRKYVYLFISMNFANATKVKSSCSTSVLLLNG